MTENRKIVHSKTLTFSGHQTDRQTDRQTENVIPMSRNPSGARQKMEIIAVCKAEPPSKSIQLLMPSIPLDLPLFNFLIHFLNSSSETETSKRELALHCFSIMSKPHFTNS